jgi:AmmeMemoRadiSam system protein B
MISMRYPIVAGQFYPGSKEGLLAELKELVPSEKKVAFYRGAIMPHAGYFYSGKTAGLVCARLSVPEVVVALATNHTGRGSELAILTESNYSTPLGEIPLASELAGILSSGRTFAEDSRAHLQEHSLEVILPFLQFRRADFALLPVVVAQMPWEAVSQAAKELAEAVTQIEAKGKKVMIVSSTDMSHYVPEEEAKAKDALAIARIKALDGAGLIKTVRENRITMCGVFPTALLLATAKLLGSRTAELVYYTTSAEASGDSSQVVGYAGLVIP